MSKCKTCGGTGRRERSNGFHRVRESCPDCNGTGQSDRLEFEEAEKDPSWEDIDEILEEFDSEKGYLEAKYKLVKIIKKRELRAAREARISEAKWALKNVRHIEGTFEGAVKLNQANRLKELESDAS